MFGVTIGITSTPSAHTSLLDSVHGVGSRNNLCSCTGTTPTACVGYVSINNEPSTAVHHTNYIAQLRHFNATKSNRVDFRLLYSGYRNCGKSLEENSTDHINDVVAGVANTHGGSQVSMVFYTGNNVFYYKKLAALHEILHTLGAFADKNELTPDTKHGDCVMSYDRNVELMEYYWNNGMYSSLLCDDCKYLISSYLCGCYYADKNNNSEG